MSEPPKKTRSRKQDVQLVVSCDAPKVAVADGRSTSIYEIDIQGGYDLFRRDRKGCAEKEQKETATKDAAKELQDACQEEVETHLEAHYPKIMETFSVNQRPSSTRNASFMVQRDILTDENKEKDRKPFMGKTNKKRQAMPTDAKQKFRKQIKNYIIESFIGDKCREMKSMVQNYHGVLDGNEVHLHHHEHHHHHHHYYTNGRPPDGETVAQTPLQENLTESPEVSVATVTTNANGAVVEHQDIEVENSTHSQGPCPPQAPCPTGETHADPPPTESPEKSDTEPLENGSPPVVEGNTQKNEEHNSTSSLKSRTGEAEVVFSRNTECSVDSVKTESTEIRGIKEEKSKSSKSYTSLVENFKSFNHLTSPIVITDQQTVPKILYIRCDCSPWNGMGTQEEVEAFQNQNSGGKDDLERNSDDGEDRNSEQSINSTSNQCQGVEEESSDELAFEVWTSKLKNELQEIKKELKRIEEKQVLEKRSTNPAFRKDKISDTGSDHKITVYSSKTFIMQPQQDAAADV